MMRRFTRDRRGATSVELAMVVLPLAMILFAAVEFSMAVRLQSALQYAATAAARCAAVNRTLCGDEAAVQGYASSHTQGVSISASSFSLTNQACGKQVSASVPFPVVAHSVMPFNYTLTVRSCYPP